MAMTLVEYAKNAEQGSGNQRYTAVLADSTPLFNWLPFENVTGGMYGYQVASDLPQVNYRAINEGFSKSTGHEDSYTERCVIAGGEMDVDIVLVQDFGPQRRGREERKQISAHAHKYTKDFIQGDTSVDRLGYNGLRKRVLAAAASGSTDRIVDAQGTALQVTEHIDKAMQQCPGANVILTTRNMERKLNKAMRTDVAGRVNFTRTEFGKKVSTYDDLPIIVMDGIDMNDPAIDDQKATPDDFMIMARFEVGHVFGIQASPPRVKDLGEIESSPVFRTRVDWRPGLVWEHPHSCVMIDNIDVTANIIS